MILRARGRHRVVDAAPRAHADAQAAVAVEVALERDRDHRERVLHAVQPHADVFVRFVRERAHVDVAAEVVARADLDGEIAQLARRVRQLDHQDARRLREPVEVVGELEQVQLFLARVPEAAHAFEAPGAVLQAVGEQADLRVVVAREAAVGVDREIAQVHEVGFLRW